MFSDCSSLCPTVAEIVLILYMQQPVWSMYCYAHCPSSLRYSALQAREQALQAQLRQEQKRREAAEARCRKAQEERSEQAAAGAE